MSVQQPEPAAGPSAEANTPATGTSALRARRERASRKPPPPRHPKPPAGADPEPAQSPAAATGAAAEAPARPPQPRSAKPDVTTGEKPAPPQASVASPTVAPANNELPAQKRTDNPGETVGEIPHEITRPPQHPDPGPSSATPPLVPDADAENTAAARPTAPPADAAPRSAPAPEPAPAPALEPVPAPEPVPAIARGETGAQPAEAHVDERRLPDLEIDLDDPTALLITPTVLSVPNTILRRFEQARMTAPSHTGLVLDALRAHAAQLPDLVKALRPGPRPGDLFPYRATPGAGSGDRPGPLRIRPTAGELGIMDRLTGWVNDEIRRGRAGVRKVSRSEVVAVALDSYLPPLRKGR
jgi:hypothetical protein